MPPANNNPVNLEQAFKSFSDHWSPRIIAQVGEMDVRAAKFSGEFIWHSHDDADEMFLVLKGSPTICLRDRDIDLKPGEIFVVPKGVEHKPMCDGECHVLVFVRRETSTTGAEVNQMTSIGKPLDLG